VTDLTRTPLELEVIQGEMSRLLIKPWTNSRDVTLVTIKPEYKTYSGGEWRLHHSGLALTTRVARQLADALVRMADTIEAES
jgi:hypothetical protein